MGMKIGFLGAGNMAKALSTAFSTLLETEMQYFYSPSGTSARDCALAVKGQVAHNLSEFPDDLDYLILAFKPQELPHLQYSLDLLPGKIISLLAGVDLLTLKKCGAKNGARVMPNTPSKIRYGMNLFFCDESWGEREKNQFKMLLSSAGEFIQLESEAQIDFLTPFTGSGPGLIFEMANLFFKSINHLEGVKTPSSLAASVKRKLISETFIGAGMMMRAHPELSFEELRNQVTSKKGVTFELLESCQEDHLEQIFYKAFSSALKRLDELKKGSFGDEKNS